MKLLGTIFDREPQDRSWAGGGRLQVRVDFFGKSEVSVSLEIDTSGMRCSEETAELRLFGWYALELFGGLGRRPVVQAFASLLLWRDWAQKLMKSSPSLPPADALLTVIRDEAFEEESWESRLARMAKMDSDPQILDIIDRKYLANVPRITEPSGRRPNRSFIATVPPFTIRVKGFGPLGRNVSFHAPHSIIAFFRYLGRKRAGDDTYTEQLSCVAHACARAYFRKEIPRFRRWTMALQIVSAAQAQFHET